ncbi:MAG: hypothetical protein ACLFSY_11135 [Desulfonatronovibrionaceae bacterium]
MPSKISEQIKKSVLSPATRQEEGWRGVFRFTPDFIGFAGHFPDRPVLPAVVQFAIATDVLGQIRGEGFEPMRVHRAKFSAVLGPGMDIAAVVGVKKEEADIVTVSCQISGPEGPASSFGMDLQRISG